MSGERITQELSLGEVLSKTLDLYKRGFAKFLIPFLIVEVITSPIGVLIRDAVVPPALGVSSTNQQFQSSFFSHFGSIILLIALLLIVGLVFGTIAGATTIKLASDQIEKGQAELRPSIRFAVSKLISVWAISLIVGIIVFFGLIALIVPGIILAIMFSLALPALLIEQLGISSSMSRSRELVSHRWLKTFALFLVVGIIIGIASFIASAIAGLFGSASGIVSGILSAFYAPIVPILLVVYYYSNVARLAPLVSQPPAPPATGASAGTRFCSNCGARLDSSVLFCPACGTRQSI
ncbi:MAG: zinc ribbon domain-containing protein [Nitrososphaerales archaeon]